ncbi:hypothetical protein [Burkholderia sp. Ac-20379]|uniref:hypothetical protein n=1 Tax=Burkholderia sp. Ac-20379 TaxID=2703900 RepID=UPI00198047A4|nr:hypothetical protein [Burkholderia sp. Ac-20379]MBN3724210.1 hypothetical protein [Burkholderia sp. Ac-20379]
MRLLRTLLVLLLCIALPLDALAASGLTGACPMHDGHAMQGAMPPHAGPMPDMAGISGISDCDGMTALPPGKRNACDHGCRMSAQCQFGSLHHPAVLAEVRRPAVLILPVRFHYAATLAVRDPNRLWRPPRAA